MFVQSSKQKKEETVDKKAEFEHVKGISIAGRSVNLIQQQRRVQSDEFTLFPPAWRHKDKEAQTERDEAIVRQRCTLIAGKF